MRLPGIDYGQVQDSSSRVGAAGEQVARAFAGLGDVVTEGLNRYAAETAKTQAMKAHAQLSTDLESLHNTIASKQYVTAKEARDALGTDIEKLGPEARQFIEGQSDAAQVPIWVVASNLYDKGAASAIDRASKHLPTKRHEEDWKLHAEGFVLDKKHALNSQMMEQVHRYNVTSQLQSIDESIKNARSDREWQRIDADIQASNVLAPEVKEGLLNKAHLARDTQPIYDALRINSIPWLKKERAELNDTEKKTNLTPEQRTHYAAMIDDRLSDIAKLSAPPKPEQVQKRAAAMFWSNIDRALAQRDEAGEKWKPTDRGDLLALLPSDSEEVGHEQYQKMREAILNATKGEKAKVKTPLDLYQAMNLAIADDPEAFKSDHFKVLWRGKERTVGLNDFRGTLSDEDFRYFANLQRTAREQKGAGAIKDFVDTKDQIAAMMPDYGVNPHTKNDDEKAKIGRIQAKVDSQLAHDFPDPTKPPTFDQKQKVISGVLAADTKQSPYRVERKTGLTGTSYTSKAVRSDVENAFADWEKKNGTTLGAEQRGVILYRYQDDEEGMAQAWSKMAGGKPLSTTDALDVWMEAHDRRINLDDLLKEAGQYTGDEAVDQRKRALIVLKERASSIARRRR